MQREKYGFYKNETLLTNTERHTTQYLIKRCDDDALIEILRNSDVDEFTRTIVAGSEYLPAWDERKIWVEETDGLGDKECVRYVCGLKIDTLDMMIYKISPDKLYEHFSSVKENVDGKDVTYFEDLVDRCPDKAGLVLGRLQPEQNDVLVGSAFDKIAERGAKYASGYLGAISDENLKFDLIAQTDMISKINQARNSEEDNTHIASDIINSLSEKSLVEFLRINTLGNLMFKLTPDSRALNAMVNKVPPEKYPDVYSVRKKNDNGKTVTLLSTTMIDKKGERADFALKLPNDVLVQLMKLDECYNALDSESAIKIVWKIGSEKYDEAMGAGRADDAYIGYYGNKARESIDFTSRRWGGVSEEDVKNIVNGAMRDMEHAKFNSEQRAKLLMELADINDINTKIPKTLLNEVSRLALEDPDVSDETSIKLLRTYAGALRGHSYDENEEYIQERIKYLSAIEILKSKN